MTMETDGLRKFLWIMFGIILTIFHRIHQMTYPIMYLCILQTHNTSWCGSRYGNRREYDDDDMYSSRYGMRRGGRRM